MAEFWDLFPAIFLLAWAGYNWLAYKYPAKIPNPLGVDPQLLTEEDDMSEDGHVLDLDEEQEPHEGARVETDWDRSDPELRERYKVKDVPLTPARGRCNNPRPTGHSHRWTSGRAITRSTPRRLASNGMTSKPVSPMPRVRDAHWSPGEWPRPMCPGPDREHSCGAPVSYYKPPGGEPAHEIDWDPSKPVMLQPCGHVLPAEAVGVVAFRAPPEDLDDHERVSDGAQMYLSQYP